MKPIQTAARDYKNTRDDSDFLIIYQFVEKLAQIIAKKMDIQYKPDITQGAAIRVIKYIDKFNPARQFHNWCYTLVLNETLFRIKNEKRYSYGIKFEDDGFEQDITPYMHLSYEPEYFRDESYLNDKDCAEALKEFNGSLGVKRKNNNEEVITDEEIKEMFYEHVVDDMTTQEIADEHNMRRSVVVYLMKKYRFALVDYIRNKYKHKEIPEFLYERHRFHNRKNY